jgi:hypothetical protein
MDYSFSGDKKKQSLALVDHGYRGLLSRFDWLF